MFQCLTPEKQNSGAREVALLGSNSVNISSSQHKWRHAAVEELQESVLPCGLATGGQCRYSGTCDTMSPTSTEEQCFLLGLCGGYIWRIETEAIQSELRVCRQTDCSESEAVVRQLPLVEVWEVQEPPLL